jgi:hypothetical protein
VRAGVSRPRRVEIYETGGLDRVIGCRNRLERGGAIGRGEDGLVNAVSGIVRERDQQQKLRESVVFERNAFGDPAFSDGEQLRKETRLIVTVVAEVFFQSELREQEGDLVKTAALKLVERVDTGFADERRVLGLSGKIGGGESHPRSVVEFVCQPAIGEVVAIAVSAACQRLDQFHPETTGSGVHGERSQ